MKEIIFILFVLLQVPYLLATDFINKNDNEAAKAQITK